MTQRLNITISIFKDSVEPGMSIGFEGDPFFISYEHRESIFNRIVSSLGTRFKGKVNSDKIDSDHGCSELDILTDDQREYGRAVFGDMSIFNNKKPH